MALIGVKVRSLTLKVASRRVPCSPLSREREEEQEGY